MRKSVVYKVSVTVDEDAIRVDPDTLTMSSDDEVHWAGTNPNRFSIEFEGKGPFAARELPHDVATRRQKPQARGHFKYSVVSASDPNLRLDPVVIVEEPPTGDSP